MRVSRIIIPFFLLMLLAIGTASAANTQGLTWAFSPGDRIDYSVRFEFGDAYTYATMKEGTYNCYVVIGTLPDIPTVVTSIPSLSNYNVEQYFTNGTTTSFLWVAVPIGNWTLMTEFLEHSMGYSENTTLINSFTEWGYDQHYQYGETQQNTVLRIAKSDGALQYVKQEMIYEDPDYNTVMEITRAGGLGLPIDDSLLIPIAIGAVVVIIVLVLVIRRR